MRAGRSAIGRLERQDVEISFQNLQSIFAEADCQARPVAGGWELSNRELPEGKVYGAISPQWVNFHFPLDCKIENDPAKRARFYRGLLELNERRLYQAKFALDDDEQLLLSAEAPVTGNYQHLTSYLLRSLVKYSVEYAEPLHSGASLEEARRWSARPIRSAEPDEFLLSPDGIFTDYLRSVSTEGWGTLDKLPQGQCWRIGYKGLLKLFDQAFLKLTNSWVSFEVSILEDPLPQALLGTPQEQAVFLRHLLRLNDEMYLAKFGLDEQARLLLLLEFPLAILDFEIFLFALRTLGRYLDSYAQELEILACPRRDRHIAMLLAQVDSAKYPFEFS